MAAASNKNEVTVGPRTFAIRGTLGKGGFSVVYAGSDSETNKKVALKMMFGVKQDAEDATYKQTCDEIKMMRKLQHKNLIKLLGYDLHAKYMDKSCVILVQELAPNRELFEYLLHSRSTFSERLVMYVINQVFGAINFMHSKGVAHRDLKPENILLDKDFTVKVADFGFAKYFHKHDQRLKMRTELGTRGYMAPEISENAAKAPRSQRKSYNEKIDTFALGVILFICSSGFPPFRQTNSDDWWFDKIMKKQWHFFWKAHERKHQFSDLVKDLLQKMLAYDANARISVQECMDHEFIKNNPAGSMMTKEDYTTEMKNRYKFVKEKLRTINETKKMKSRAEPMPIEEKPDALSQVDGFIPSELLCMNDIRKEIYEAPDPSTDEQKEALSKLLAKKIVEINYPDMDARTMHGVTKEMTDVYQKMSSEDLASVKNAFCNVQTGEDLAAYLPADDGLDAKKIVHQLNKCLLGTEGTTEVSMNSVLQYQEFDKIDLCLMDPAKLEENEGLIFNVKYGFGTFVHFMKDLHEKTPSVDINIEVGTATVMYEISDTMVLGDEEVTVTDQVSLLIQMFAFDKSLGDAPTGHALTIRPAGFLQTHLNAFEMCWKQMLEESNMLHPLFVQ